MSKQIDALKLALEALKENQHLVADNERHAYVMEYNSIIEKCEEALAEPEHEPATKEQIREAMIFNLPLYTTPPQRKPLTENEIKNLWYDACQANLELTSQFIVHLVRSIEAAHGIKE